MVTPERAEVPAGALASSRSSEAGGTALDELLAQDLPAEELLERILHLEVTWAATTDAPEIRRRRHGRSERAEENP